MSWLGPRCIALAVAALALVTLPLWLDHSYYIKIATEMLYWAIFALALNVLVGYGGLVSLGHAGLFAITGYAVGLMLEAGYGHVAADLTALAVIFVSSALYALLALRATGLGFLMITLALGQIVWGIAYRWADLTHGDNGVNVRSIPAPFGIELTSAGSFYLMTLVVFFI